MRPETLRSSGYSPKNFLESGKSSFEDNQKIRARIQFRTMTHFKLMEMESPLFEESGNVLMNHNYQKQAFKHWDIAYQHGHRPYSMSMALGHHALVNGQFNQSQEIFKDLAIKNPADPVVFNEYGVVHFMEAIHQRHNIEKFSMLRYLATQSFETSIANQPTTIAEQNKRVVAALTYTPHYGSPHYYLKTHSNSSTRMIDAIIRSLELNKTESKSATGLGFTPTTDKEGNFSLNPTITSTSYKVPVVANELALQELAKIKLDQASEENHIPRLKP